MVGIIKNLFFTKSNSERVQERLNSGYRPKDSKKYTEKELNTLFGKAAKEYNATHDKKIFL